MIINIDPKIWGKKYWDFLEQYVNTYPHNPTDSEKKTYHDVLFGILTTLPCQKCRDDTQIKLHYYPLDNSALKDQINLKMWFDSIRMAIHNGH